MIPISNVSINNETIEAVQEVFKSGQLAQNGKVEEFEKSFARYIGTKYAVAVSSGTAALHLALTASGVGDGDEVITTPFSFIATANCCLFCGAVPVFVDIDPETFNISPELIERRITSKTKAVIIVHLFGQPCDMDKIKEICNRHNLILIEDSCQAHGAEYNGDKVGSFGTGCFSFYPTKNLTTGEGGMITTNDETIAQKAGMMRQHGQSQRYVHDILGFNYRMTDIAAAIGICQLKGLDNRNDKRIKNALYLSEHIDKISGLVSPCIAPNRKHVFHQFTLKVTEDYPLSRDDLQRKLSEQGIGTAIHYPIPIHKQPVYLKLGYSEVLENAEKAAGQVLSIPVHPGLDENQLETITNALKP